MWRKDRKKRDAKGDACRDTDRDAHYKSRSRIPNTPNTPSIVPTASLLSLKSPQSHSKVND